ncbi:hypothetical protein I6N91_01980 [Arthrobacter sp. MSA 4-2]|uniref:hypothetical protein n=1 Tax=Arthrobacter sp. MSA 4-2 TaxID=2794349 RepID=UPI0018E707FA|nr:hypothetical protein [Arthrobacter sp. MSA 4-2]MBJ2119746.1 hypothetical protein [Arthrobacter sp. MSA 4-2]
MSNNNNDPNTHNGTLRVVDRRSTETKAAAKPTEFVAHVSSVPATALTALLVGDGGEGQDEFNADDAMRLIAFLTIGYIVSRGLATSGNREHYSNSKHPARGGPPAEALASAGRSAHSPPRLR